MKRLTASGSAPIRIVYPSGSDRATASAPILLPAPPRFSITTCWPQISDSFAATIRPTPSVPPPGGNGTTRRTTREGQAWASAVLQSDIGARADAAMSPFRRRRLSMIAPSMPRSLADRDVGGLDDRPPFLHLGFEMCAELLRGRADDHDAELLKPLLDERV